MDFFVGGGCYSPVGRQGMEFLRFLFIEMLKVERSGFRLGTDAITTIQLRMRSCTHLVSGMNKCDQIVTHTFR